jgi:uncharacterized membrane protein
MSQVTAPPPWPDLSPRPVVAPTERDPLARFASEALSGPVGSHARMGAGWWTPIRVLLAVTTVAFAIGMLQKAPCETENWSASPTPYTHLCYSDIGYLYSYRGFAEGWVPYLDHGYRYPTMEYPVLTGFFAYGAAVVTHWLVDEPDVSSIPGNQVAADLDVQRDSAVYFAVTVVGLFVCALLAVWALARVHQNRPWDAMAMASAPVLVLAGTINWDLLAVAFVAGALLAWSRSRPILCGVLIGLGTSAKLYPLFILGPLLVLCLRSGRIRAWAGALAGGAASWVVVNAPIYYAAPCQWSEFWRFNFDRAGDFGSFWQVLAQSGHPYSAQTVNTWSSLGFGAGCLAIAGLGLFARRRPRLPQLVFLVVASFLLVNKVYSPQYVLWLLPLAVLARPRWRDLLIWQACEVLYFVTIWLHIEGSLAPAVSGQPDRVYWLMVFVRLAGTIYLMVIVVRDIVQPWHDPVREDGLSDDPAGGVLDETEDAPWLVRARARGSRTAV